MDKITSLAWYLEPSKETEKQLEAMKLPFEARNLNTRKAHSLNFAE